MVVMFQPSLKARQLPRLYRIDSYQPGYKNSQCATSVVVAKYHTLIAHQIAEQ